MSVLRNKRIILGITGGIAAYKGAELCRLLVKSGCDVSVIMTESAQRFISPMTLEVLSGRPVGISLWATISDTSSAQRQIHHTEAGRHADCIVIAPATANFVGRLSHGLADDLLTSVVMASTTPVLICPAMNVEMFHNPLVQQNFARLSEISRYSVVPPGSGDLACGVIGEGRLAEAADILAALERVFLPKDLTNRNFLVTAGPTHEHFDPVRYLSNPSTGKMGYALATAAQERGATVQLVSGPVHLPTPPDVELVSVVSAEQMAEAVEQYIAKTDVLLMAAAVSDWRPEIYQAQKVKKETSNRDPSRHVMLTRTRDILLETKRHHNVVRVGFAAETEHILQHAKDKLVRKELDLIVANDVAAPQTSQTGFGTDTNAGWLVFSDGRTEELPLMTKKAFAHRILDAIVTIRKKEAV